MQQIITKYLEIILQNIEKDQQMLNNPWIVFTVIPFFLYSIFAIIKWYFLLAPITIPFGFFAWGMKTQSLISFFNKKEK